MIFIYIIFIILLFVIVMQYSQFKDKKKPVPILFFSLFIMGILVVFFVQKNIKPLDIQTNISWIEKSIFLLLGLVFLSIVALKYIFLKNKKQQTKIDNFWMYQSFSLVVLMLVGLVYVYYKQVQKTNLEKQYFKQSIFVKNGICYTDSLCLNMINYMITPPQKKLQIHIQSMDMVYCFSIKKPEKKIILIPPQKIILPIITNQDTIYFFAEW